MISSKQIRQWVASSLNEVVRPVFTGRGCILCFHRVVEGLGFSSFADNRALEVGVDDLRWILEWTKKRGLAAISIDEVPERLKSPKKGKFVCFTFDDGYKDNLLSALPVFQQFRIPFTVYSTTRLSDASASLWWYKLEQVVKTRPDLALDWAGQRWKFDLRTASLREKAFLELAHLIRNQGQIDRDLLIALICRETGLNLLDQTRSLILDWDGLRQLAADPLVTVGAHTVGHHTLNLLSEAEARAELLGSKQIIEAQLHREVKHLAYPFGGRNAVSSREFRLAEECGFSTAVTTRCANLFPDHSNHLYALPRLVVSGNYRVSTLLPRLESGLLPARNYRWRRVVTD